MKIYLAGGFVSRWQQAVKDAVRHLEHVEFLDPSEHKIHDSRNYTEKDKQMIRECDMVFAYMEVDNPGWPNLAFEIGYAHALDKPVVFVNEKRRRYAEMLHVVCHSPASFKAALNDLPKMKELR